jgi:hypothetical protein
MDKRKSSDRPENGLIRTAALILFGIAIAEGAWVVASIWRSGPRFWRYLGFAPDLAGGLLGWLTGVAVAGIFVAYAVRLPSVRSNLLRPSFLKILALFAAFSAGILEEVFFRKILMDYVAGVGGSPALQVLASAATFGIVHGVWGIFGRNLRAAWAATAATACLGGALAIVYLVSGRSLAPCIAAHALIDALAEPGLVLSALRGEMSKRVSHDELR